VTNFHEDGTNERVCRRLEVILNAFNGAQFSVPAKPGIFDALAAAARIEIPVET
jgi:hypothetical protein